MKPKIIRYTTKSGVVKTYVYDKVYTKKPRRANTLVSSKGVIYKKEVNKLEQKIRNSDISLAEQADLITALHHHVDRRSKEIKEGKTDKRLTINGFYGIMEDTRLDRFFANFGSSLEQFAEDYGFDIEEVRAKGFFNKDKDLIVNGRTFKFQYNYEGDFYTEVL